MAEELTFRLEDFEGPLELLLALVAKHKMDLHNIPILTLIDQYTRTVEAAQTADPDGASSFIEMAARQNCRTSVRHTALICCRTPLLPTSAPAAGSRCGWR